MRHWDADDWAILAMSVGVGFTFLAMGVAIIVWAVRACH